MSRYNGEVTRRTPSRSGDAGGDTHTLQLLDNVADGCGQDNVGVCGRQPLTMQSSNAGGWRAEGAGVDVATTWAAPDLLHHKALLHMVFF